MRSPILISFLLLLSSLGLWSCSSARMSDAESTRFFRQGKYEEAATSLRKGILEQGENGRDLLLYLLDLGLTLHTEGKYEESNRIFQKADQIADIKDYTSLATESATLLTSDNIKDYQGEDFEKVLINTYLAMNYALIGDTENALVEARRVNRKLQMMVTEGKRKYKQNAFARYLSGVLYESEGSPNDAYLDYKIVHELVPSFPGLGLDLWRTARLSGLRDDLEKWDSEFRLTQADHDRAMQTAKRSGKAEIIVFYENGISPLKKPNPDFSELPRFYPRFNPVREAKVFLNQQEVATTQGLHDIEATAIANLDEKYAGMIAKKLAGLVAKEVLADQVRRRTHNELLGALTRLALYASDQADLRSWNLLPKDLQLARLQVEPGTYEIGLLPLGGPAIPAKTVQVQAGKKAFVSFRYMP